MSFDLEQLAVACHAEAESGQLLARALVVDWNRFKVGARVFFTFAERFLTGEATIVKVDHDHSAGPIFLEADEEIEFLGKTFQAQPWEIQLKPISLDEVEAFLAAGTPVQRRT